LQAQTPTHCRHREMAMNVDKLISLAGDIGWFQLLMVIWYQVEYEFVADLNTSYKLSRAARA